MGHRMCVALSAVVVLALLIFTAGTTMAVEVLTSFEGLTNADSVALDGSATDIPDTNLAVGPDHIFEITNLSGRISDKAGRPISTFTTHSFFGLDAGSSGFDPRIIYDALSGRWFATYASVTFQGPTTSSVVLAVSTSSDPTAGFCRFRLGNPTSESTFTHDYPFIGVSDDKVIVSYAANAIGPDGVNGWGYYVINKADLLVCAAPRITRVAPRSSGGFLFGVHSLSSTGDLYMVGAVDGVMDQLAVRTISGVPGESL